MTHAELNMLISGHILRRIRGTNNTEDGDRIRLAVKRVFLERDEAREQLAEAHKIIAELKDTIECVKEDYRQLEHDINRLIERMNNR